MLRPDRHQAPTDQAVASELDTCVEDGCGQNHLSGYQHVEELKRVLVEARRKACSQRLCKTDPNKLIFRQSLPSMVG